MEMIIVLFYGILSFIFIFTPNIPAKVFYKNTKNIKKAKWHIRTKLGSIIFIWFIFLFIKYVLG